MFLFFNTRVFSKSHKKTAEGLTRVRQPLGVMDGYDGYYRTSFAALAPALTSTTPLAASWIEVVPAGTVPL